MSAGEPIGERNFDNYLGGKTSMSTQENVRAV